MKKTIRKNRKGFTLVEVMIVMAIIGALLTITIISFSPSKQKVNLDASVNEFASVLSLAKGNALQGKLPSGSDSICGYGVNFTSATAYRIFYYTGNCSNPSVTSKTTVFSKSFKSGISLQSPAYSSTALYFSLPRADVVLTSSSFVITNGSTTKTVSINSNGSIEVN